MAARSGPIYAVVHGAADADPQIAALRKELDRQRLVGAGLLAETVAARLGVTSVDDIRDTLWVLMSPLQYTLIVQELGRPASYYRDWMAQALRALLPRLG